MSDVIESDEIAVPVVCPRCDTTTRVPIDDVERTIRRHNERLHEGEEVAGIDPTLRDELARIVAEDLEFL